MNRPPFELPSGLALVRVRRGSGSQSVADLRRFLSETDTSYPGIQRWFDRKVRPGLDDGSRCAYLVYDGSVPVASAIARTGRDTKLCNLRVTSLKENQGVGTVLLGAIALGASRSATMYFTASQAVLESTGEFFSEFGFHDSGPAEKQYRLWDQEWACSAPMPRVLASVRDKLPRVLASWRASGRGPCDLMLSIRPKFADAIFAGTKTIEVRRRFSTVWEGARALIYATAPSSEILGECVIENVTQASPALVWSRFGDALHCSRDEFMRYCEDRDVVSALRLGHVTSYRAPVSREWLATLV